MIYDWLVMIVAIILMPILLIMIIMQLLVLYKGSEVLYYEIKDCFSMIKKYRKERLNEGGGQ